MVAIGEANGVRTVALQTAMETVLGCAAGNGLEVTESVETLEGGGPADLVEVTVALAREMVALAGVDCDDPADVLASGRALPVWRAMVAAQGGDPDAPIPTATEIETVTAPHGGRAHPPRRARGRELPRGASARAGRARSIRCRRRPAWCAGPSPAIGSQRATCCSNSTSTTRSSCPMPWPRSTAVSRSASEPIAPVAPGARPDRAGVTSAHGTSDPRTDSQRTQGRLARPPRRRTAARDHRRARGSGGIRRPADDGLRASSARG